MKKVILKRKEFNKAFNLKTNNKPTSIDKKRVNLHYDLLKEELDEYLESAIDKNIVETADAITDIFYVLLGTAAEHGMLDSLELLFNEVHRSNMSKLGDHGMPVYREDGKVLKSKNFTKPNLKPILGMERIGYAPINDSDIALIEKIYDVKTFNLNHDKKALEKDFLGLIHKLHSSLDDNLSLTDEDDRFIDVDDRFIDKNGQNE